MGEKNGAQAAPLKMTSLAGKDTIQQQQGSKGAGQMEPLQQMVSQVIRQVMMEAEHRIVTQLGTKIDHLQQQITGINKQLVELKKKTKQVEKDVRVLDTDVKLLKSDYQDLSTSLLKLLFERSMYNLKIQNFLEVENERIEEAIIKWLKEVTQFSEEILKLAIDTIYRAQSSQTPKTRKVTEVMVKFLNRGVRDKIVAMMAYNDHYIADQRILILRDIPYEIHQRLQPYKELVVLLRGKQVKYRWLIPEGLSFTVEQNCYIIKSTFELNQFLTDHGEKLGKSRG